MPTFTPLIPATAAANAAEFCYSPGLVVDGWLHISGHIGFAPDGSVPSSRAEQAENAFRAIGEVLALAGAAFSNVVSLISYHTDDVAENEDWFNPIKDSFLPEPPFPACAAIGVASLAVSGAVVEIAAVAKL
ncbi:enamine deaminase RidA (YjgF/YER057c/UK114 family) [Kribbella sp. VKM Ac-2527]|uniref:Enamine deaminase RidA (YjgF/YER057c/UK114 family) n=1 Tax=Kribbella caucasensis TaxID=2512215 RepID=A0A4R6KII9_9ACTN|nr:Rid family hydrolase [Kribbella sp. VKM Ac-2527]TDO50527.1 enamine deaminase RidA (YjgF/YER057c/UK114 family) [Kribbella sp. VKM Ac-2527]